MPAGTLTRVYTAPPASFRKNYKAKFRKMIRIKRKQKPKPKINKGFADLSGCATPLPRILRTSLHYTDYINVSISNSAVRTHVWNMNSLYDPDVTAVGAQAPMRDDLFGLYSQIKVLKTRVRHKLSNTTARPMRLYYFLDLSPSITYEDATQFDLTQHPGFLAFRTVGTQDGTKSDSSITLNIDIMKWFKKLAYNQPVPFNNPINNFNTNGAGPNTNLYLHVYAQCIDELITQTQAYIYSIDFDFKVECNQLLISPAVSYD